MSQSVTEVYDAFRAANVGENLARAAAGAIAGREDLVTKLDLERAIGRVEADLKAEIGRVEADLKAEIGRVEADLKAEIADVKSDLKLLKFAYGPVVLGLLVKLVFFP